MLPIDSWPMTNVERSAVSDFVRLMHLPLPFCVLAFATIGAALSERVYLDRLLLTYIGILLALCLGAYSLDELHGRPYHTRFEDTTLRCLAMAGITGGAMVAAYLTWTVSLGIVILAVVAAFFIFAYNLELFGGRFHTVGWFGASWGGLTTFSGYYIQSATVTLQPLLVSLMATLLGVSIVLLTHKFRPQQLSKKLGTVPNSDLIEFSRYARRAAWTVAQLECYAVIALAIGLIIPKLI